MTVPLAAADRHRRLALRCGQRPGPVSQGVAFAREVLADWFWAPSPAGDDIQLVAAELLANAVRHAGGPLTIDLAQYGSRLRVAVADALPQAELPDPATHKPAQIGGHGLFVVDRIALSWGTSPAGSGKIVWADLPAPPGRPGAG